MKLLLVTLVALVGRAEAQCACSTLDACVDQRGPQRAANEQQCIAQCSSDATVTASLGGSAAQVGQCYSQKSQISEQKYLAMRQCLTSQNARKYCTNGGGIVNPVNPFPVNPVNPVNPFPVNPFPVNPTPAPFTGAPLPLPNLPGFPNLPTNNFPNTGTNQQFLDLLNQLTQQRSQQRFRGKRHASRYFPAAAPFERCLRTCIRGLTQTQTGGLSFGDFGGGFGGGFDGGFGRGRGRGGRGRGKREVRVKRGGGGRGGGLVKADERLCATQNSCTRTFNTNSYQGKQLCRTQVDANPATNSTQTFLQFCSCMSQATAATGAAPVNCQSLAAGSGRFRSRNDDSDEDFDD